MYINGHWTDGQGTRTISVKNPATGSTIETIPKGTKQGVDRAVEFANDSIYGLVAYLFTEDPDRGLDIAERLEYGTVGINNVSGGDAPCPYGGWKQSGLGLENSEYGMNQYLKLKHVRATSLS